MNTTMIPNGYGKENQAHTMTIKIITIKLTFYKEGGIWEQEGLGVGGVAAGGVRGKSGSNLYLDLLDTYRSKCSKQETEIYTNLCYKG